MDFILQQPNYRLQIRCLDIQRGISSFAQQCTDDMLVQDIQIVYKPNTIIIACHIVD